MVFNVYLHKYVVDTLRCFGNISDVVNEILNYCENNNGFMDYPECVDRKGCSRYSIDVHNEQYVELYNTFGATSPRVSLRRIIYWFVDNEIYESEQWNMEIKSFGEDDKVFLLNKCNDILHILKKMGKRTVKNENDIMIDIKDKVRELTEVINER